MPKSAINHAGVLTDVPANAFGEGFLVIELNVDHRMPEVGHRPDRSELHPAIHDRLNWIRDVLLYFLWREPAGEGEDLQERGRHVRERMEIQVFARMQCV